MDKKGGAPRKAPEGLTVSLSFLVDSALVTRIDAAKDRRNAEGGPTWARADMMRALLTYALDREDPSDAGGDRFVRSAAPSGAKRKGAK